MDLRNRRTFIAFFAILAFVVTDVIVLLVGGGAMELGIAVGAGVGIAALLTGVYRVGRKAGHPHSHAVAESAVALGFVYTAVLVMRLLTQSPFGKRSVTETGAGLLAAFVGAVLIVGLTGLLGRYNTA